MATKTVRVWNGASANPKDAWFVCSLSSINSALNASGGLPSGHKITSAKLKLNFSHDGGYDTSKVYVSYGFGYTGKLNVTLYGEVDINKGSAEYPSGGVEIKNYFSKLESPCAINLSNYGSYLAVHFTTANILVDKFYVNYADIVITYEPIVYSVTVNVNEGGRITGGGTYTSGSTATITAVPNEGYTFVGWANQSGDITVTTNPYSFTVKANTTINAVFEKLKYTVTIETPDASAGTIIGAVSDEYAYGTELTLTAVPNEGYYFDRWIFDWMHDTSVNPMDNPITFTVLGEEYVMARILENPKHRIEVGVNNSEWGAVTGAESGDYTEGTELTLKAVPEKNCKFVGWSDGVTTAIRTVEVYGDATYTAIFEKKTGTIITKVYIAGYEAEEPHCTISGLNFGSNTVDVGTEINFVVTPEENYYQVQLIRVLVGEEDDGGCLFPGEYDNPCTLEVSSEGTSVIEIYIVDIRPTVYLDVSEGGTVTGLDIGENRLDEGTEVTITAIPDYGYKLDKIVVQEEIIDGEFVYFVGNEYTHSPLTLTITSKAVYIFVTFIKIEGKVDLVCSGENLERLTITGLDIGTNVLEYGREYTLTAIPDEGYKTVMSVRYDRTAIGEDYCLSIPLGEHETESITFSIVKAGIAEIVLFAENLKINNILADLVQSSGVLLNEIDPNEILADTTKIYG